MYKEMVYLVRTSAHVTARQFVSVLIKEINRMKIAQGSGASRSRTCFYFGSIFGIQSIVGAGFKVFDTTGTDLGFLDHANLADVAVEVHGAAAISVVVFAYIAGFRR